VEHLTLSGSPFEIGAQHGNALRELIPGVLQALAPAAVTPARARQTLAASVARRARPA
jgi:hypothetical protein